VIFVSLSKKSEGERVSTKNRMRIWHIQEVGSIKKIIHVNGNCQIFHNFVSNGEKQLFDIPSSLALASKRRESSHNDK
jgi:hypothetical protein